MSATATPTLTDRSDFRNVMLGGAKIGALIGAAVVLYLLVSRFVPAGMLREAVQALVVLTAGAAASVLPAHWVAARRTEGVAGAAALGFWGTVVFMAIDIVLLRPLKAYPWTWDAVGGGSTWWYLPLWWMLGTFLAWMGAIVTAQLAARGDVAPAGVALGPLVGGGVLAVIGGLPPIGLSLPVAAGAGFTVSLTLRALLALARKS